MSDKHRAASPIKIINKQTVQKVYPINVYSNSDVNDDIFISDWTEVKSPKQLK